MRITRLAILSLPAALGLAACVETTTRPEPAPVDTCNLAQVAGLVGNPLSTFDAGAIKGPVRILAPGSMMTMDHRPDRMNIYHDARGVVEKVTCG